MRRGGGTYHGQAAHISPFLEPFPKHIRIRLTFAQLLGSLEEQLIEVRNTNEYRGCQHISSVNMRVQPCRVPGYV